MFSCPQGLPVVIIRPQDTNLSTAAGCSWTSACRTVIQSSHWLSWKGANANVFVPKSWTRGFTLTKSVCWRPQQSFKLKLPKRITRCSVPLSLCMLLLSVSHLHAYLHAAWLSSSQRHSRVWRDSRAVVQSMERGAKRSDRWQQPLVHNKKRSWETYET